MSEMVFQQFEVGEHAVFAYLVGDNDAGEAFVVDPADDVDELINMARKYDLEIKYIVNTHGHVDHVMGNSEMKEKTGAQIVIHEDEASYLSKVGDFWLQLFNARKSPPADVVIKDGDFVQVGSLKWQIIHTPGHTPGGICLYNQTKRICLSGDTLFVGSVGRTDGPKSSWHQLFYSIQTKLLTLPDETIIYPGHNYGLTPYSTIGEEKETNPFLNGEISI